MYNATKLRNIEGFSKDGDFVHTVQITGPDGMKASVLTLGARLLDLRMPDGRPLTLSLDNLADIESDAAYIGSVVGRVCNRIRGGTFCIGEEKTQLEKNCKDAHHIHGGRKAWDKRLFTVSKRSESSVELFLYSPDKDQGYPSAVEVYVTYKLRGNGELFISLQTTNVGTKPTITNMTVHPYFDLTGAGGKVESSVLTNFVHAPHASRFLELDDDNIPTGKYTALEKTQLDFRKPCALESVISGGYDQYLVHEEETIGDADNASSSDLRKVFQISTPDDCPGGSVCMHVLTNMPGFQFYTPSGFAEGQPFRKFGSFAVEPSEFIDAPNNANFPPITLDPNKTRDQHIVYKFTV